MITLITVFDTGFQSVSANVPNRDEATRIITQTHPSNVKHFIVVDTRFRSKIFIYASNGEMIDEVEL